MELTLEQHDEIYDFINEYPTFREEGFLPLEQSVVLQKYKKIYPNFNMEKYGEAMMGNTCGMYNGQFVMYHCDVHKAIVCGIENRDLSLEEWD